MMDRIRYRKFWLLFILLAGAVNIVIGQQWLFKEAACPRFQDALLFAGTGLGVFLMVLHAIITPHDTFIRKVTTVGIVLAAGLLLPAIAGPFFSQFSEVRAQFCASCDELLASAETLHRVAQNPSETNRLGKLESAEYFVRQCIARKEVLSGKDAESKLAYILVDKATLLVAENRCAETKTALNEAYTLTGKHGLSDLRRVIELEQQNRERVCYTPTPTLTPTPSRTPTLTPTPTRTPTRVPTEWPEPDVPCTPPQYAPVEAIRLTEPIPQGAPLPRPRGTFFQGREVKVEHRFTGNEIVCLASTRDGWGELKVDDFLLLEIIPDDRSQQKTEWKHDFYASDAHGPGKPGIKAYRAEDITRKFSRGGYSVRLQLTDFFAEYYSSSAVWLIIWTK